MSKVSLQYLEHIAYQLRVDSLKATTEAGSGHVTSCLSAADLVTALFFHAMQYDLKNHANPNNDRFILSKGHAAPVLYSVYKELGLLTEKELLTLRQFDSMLEGHPTPRFKYNEAATGSLGQGLSIGLGMALATKMDNKSYYTYVLLGDSEMTEGSNWEAAELAAYYQTNNLIALLDANRLGQSTATIEGHDLNRYQEKFNAFGWETIVIDGHEMAAIIKAIDQARTVTLKPTIIIAYTYKGYGLDANIEDANGFHGKAFSKKELPELLDRLQKRFPKAANYKPTPEDLEFFKQKVFGEEKSKKISIPQQLPEPDYVKEELIATRKVYGQALAKLGEVIPEIISLDAEVKNSTFAEIFEKKFPARFIQCYVAEQNMIGMAVGLTSRGKMPFSSTFSSFVSRAHDQLRMAAIGRVPLRVVGSHAGVSIGQDGPSQMGLEDIAIMRSLPDSIVLYPCDAVSTYKLVEQMAKYTNGISYLRTTRGETPVIYDNSEQFNLGACKVLRKSNNDVACVVAAGITVFEALKAYEELKKQNILIRVIDCYSIKPLPVQVLLKEAQESGNKIITVEDHYREGGLGEAICYTLRNQNITIECLAVTKLPCSGKPEELLAFENINYQAIINSVLKK